MKCGLLTGLLVATLGLFANESLAEQYGFTDKWSSGPQRNEWTNRLQAMSETPVWAKFHLVGHLHAVSCTIPLPSVAATDLRDFLLLQLREQLGLAADEDLEIAGEFEFQVPFYDGQRLRPITWREYRFQVSHAGYHELGRNVVVLVDPDRSAVRGIFNGHIPTVFGFGPASIQYDLATAVAKAKSHAGQGLELVRYALGWFTPTWLESRSPGIKRLVWSLRVLDAEGAERDYLVSSDTGEILDATSGRFWFAHQKHESYALGGATYYSTILGSPSCSTLGPGCTDPAFSDSLVSRVFVPEMVTALQELTTPGFAGPSSLFFLPGSWSQFLLLRPYQNRHSDPSTNYFELVLGATASTASGFCPQNAAPCGKGGGAAYMFGPSDVDGAVYAHEYAHPFLTVVKSLRSQTGYDGQTTEGWCDVVGVALENVVLSSRRPCGPFLSCVAPRTDFVLTAPSANMKFDLNLRATTCGEPRPWIGRTFAAAAREFTVYWTGIQSLPTQPGVAYEPLDRSIEIMLGTVLQAFAITPDVNPTATDYHAALVALSGIQFGLSPVSGFPAAFLAQELEATQGPQCP